MNELCLCCSIEKPDARMRLIIGDRHEGPYCDECWSEECECHQK